MKDTELLALLEYASKFAAVKDYRAYLNQVIVDNKENTSIIVASDGHKLVKITLPKQDNMPSKITLESIKNAVKTKLISLLTYSGDHVGEFPDYDRLIPKELKLNNCEPLEETSTVSINAAYLGIAFSGLTQLNKKLSNSGNKFGEVRIVQCSNTRACVFKAEFKNLDVTIDILIMPIRI